MLTIKLYLWKRKMMLKNDMDNTNKWLYMNKFKLNEGKTKILQLNIKIT